MRYDSFLVWELNSCLDIKLVGHASGQIINLWTFWPFHLQPLKVLKSFSLPTRTSITSCGGSKRFPKEIVNCGQGFPREWWQGEQQRAFFPKSFPRNQFEGGPRGLCPIWGLRGSGPALSWISSVHFTLSNDGRRSRRKIWIFHNSEVAVLPTRRPLASVSYWDWREKAFSVMRPVEVPSRVERYGSKSARKDVWVDLYGCAHALNLTAPTCSRRRLSTEVSKSYNPIPEARKDYNFIPIYWDLGIRNCCTGLCFQQRGSVIHNMVAVVM